MPNNLDPISDNCYPETTILVNKLDIHDADLLEVAEATIVTAKMALWEQQPLRTSFDFDHYKAIHQYLFEDLYDWAGQV